MTGEKKKIGASREEKEALEKYFLQFLNIEKLFPLLPGIGNREAVAGLMGLEVDELESLRSRFRENARQAGEELLQDEELADAMERLPFEEGEKIIALGDSLTDDLQSWFSIFSSMAVQAIPDRELNFVNSGISSQTTSEALRRLHRDVLSLKPDRVIVSLGTFDAIRLSIAPERTLLPLSETWENLNTIASAIERVTDHPVIWISPPPVIPALLEEMELFDFQIIEKDLFRVREVIAAKGGVIVDPAGRRMGHPPEAWYYLGDGIHPSLSGHTNTVRELIRCLGNS